MGFAAYSTWDAYRPGTSLESVGASHDVDDRLPDVVHHRASPDCRGVHLLNTRIASLRWVSSAIGVIRP